MLARFGVVSGIVFGLHGGPREQEAGKISVSGFNIALGTNHLCLLFYPATGPCSRNTGQYDGESYPHFHTPRQKKKNQKENLGDDEFACAFCMRGTYKAQRAQRSDWTEA